MTAEERDQLRTTIAALEQDARATGATIEMLDRRREELGRRRAAVQARMHELRVRLATPSLVAGKQVM